jgi:glycosyltransferase involved in cell wall biosynthesis
LELAKLGRKKLPLYQRRSRQNDAAAKPNVKMLSVIVATKDSERVLVPTLAALVPGAMAGVVSEVIIADGGSCDDTSIVAEHAGCNFVTAEGSLAAQLKAGAAKARARWLLFLQPGIVLEATWTTDAQRFAERRANADCAAVFRRGAPERSGLRDALSFLAAALGARPRPEQGLLIAKPFYTALGGHSLSAANPEADLIRRIGRRHIVRLPTVAHTAS